MENNLLLFPEEIEEETPTREFTIENLRGQYGYELATGLLHQMLDLGIITRVNSPKLTRKTANLSLPICLNYCRITLDDKAYQSEHVTGG